MNPNAIGVLLWMVAAPVFLVLWLLNRRKFSKLTADSRQAADLNQAALARGAAEHEATKAKYVERRRQRRHPVYQKPELLAEAPNQVWSWE